MLSKWSLREVMVMSALAVVFAVVYLLFLQVGNVLFGVMGPMGYEVIFGIWFIVSIIAMYIIRKPGAAVISETMAATIEVLIGNAIGPSLILSGLIQGLGAEAAFALTRYRSFSTLTLIMSGVGAAVFSFAWGFYVSGFAQLNPWLLGSMFAVRCLSGALLAGLLGKWLTEKLADTGALNSFPIAKERKNRGGGSHAA
ncbi:ECF transporter S component [Mangrovibacillus cuniculi]|uniref:Thiamine permease n=1 Tax=Mangrovibacillus cuniculi TaxID=2593652 RepID=A0A7S8C912_9BACI|nr:ECF transporter S component [Mangrovibacillus cuniculi]QPC45521.1 thiamine permease [Mangrovibacillus cuniculi]